MKKRVYAALLIGILAINLLSFLAHRSWAETDASNPPNLQVQVQSVVPNDLQWNPHSEFAGVESAIAFGNPSDSELYVLFGKMGGGAIFPAHTHPDARITTVISGVMYYGIGKQFDRTDIQPYPAGSIIYTPAGTPHFMWVQNDETIMQETGFGPTGIRFMADNE
ncbi:MAG: cupin domain-containing protein [Cyanobacteria bacterium P01_D01_bin.71]